MSPTRAIHPPSATLHSRSIFIAGPTAVGKSAVALALAEHVDGEVISVDSMQVYRGLDTGTAKPSAAERARVPHHLIDVVDITEPFDAAKFVELARKAAAGIQSRGRVSILCGGTGLYFKAFLEGLGESPPPNPALRGELEATPLAALLKELEKGDPATFERIDRQNPRRIIRAVEVIRLTGKPLSAQRARWSRAADAPNVTNALRGRSLHRMVCLTRVPADLHARINSRIEKMFAEGLVEETRQLLRQGLEQNKTAMQALGYRQVVEHIRGKRSLPETIELVKVKTRQFAKRQMTWFRNQPGLDRIQLAPTDEISAIVSRLNLN